MRLSPHSFRSLSFLQNGFKEGIQTAIDSAINFGKSALGIVTGNFENVQQMQTAVKSGGIIDGISNVLNFTINKVVNSGKIPYALGSAIKTGKNAIFAGLLRGGRKFCRGGARSP